MRQNNWNRSALASAHRKVKPYVVRFQVLTATNMKMAVFWDIAPCSLIDIDPDDGGSKYL
jgi:hypothetical protein